MRKFLITMMCIVMVVCFMPTVAMAVPTDVCPGGESCPHEAAVGNTHYETLTEAISEINAGSASGSMLMLLKDVTVSDTITISQSMTLDLNTNTLTCDSEGSTSSTIFENSSAILLEVKNGSIQSTGDRAVFFWSNSGSLTLTDVTVTAGKARAIKMVGSATVTVGTGANVTGNDFAISMTNAGAKTLNIYGTVNGIGTEAVYSSASDEPTIAIFDGAKVMSDEGEAIWFTKPIVLKVSGGTLEGGNDIALLGENEIDEAVEKITLNADSSIAGGYFNGGIDISSDTIPFITGGRFSSNVSAYKAAEKHCSNESNETGAMYLVHDHSIISGYILCPATCTGDGIIHTLPNADYSKVDEAIAKANALNKNDYKDFTALESAIKAVVRGKNITEQAEVDAMAEAIEEAIKALEKKPLTGPSIPSTPTDNVTNSGTSGTDNATTSADLSNTTSTSNGTTAATVDKTTADKIVDKAVANKSEEIVIDATANSATAANSTTIAQVTIPTDTLGAIAEKTEADVTIKTDVAEVKMDNAAAAAVSEQAEGDTVQIIAEKVKEDATEVHFELKVVCSDGKVISDFKGGNVSVTVTLPKAMADKKVVCVYIDDNGHMSKMEGQKNADGTYTFNTGHFSSYVIMAEEEADAAIAAQKEAIKNIKIKLTSKQVKTKAGKKAVKITWTAAAGDKVLDGVEVFRSTERYKGYGTEPFYTSTKGGNKGSYTNTKSLKKGTRYYYRVRGYVLVNGQKVYTDYSTKAWRTV